MRYLNKYSNDSYLFRRAKAFHLEIFHFSADCTMLDCRWFKRKNEIAFFKEK